MQSLPGFMETAWVLPGPLRCFVFIRTELHGQCSNDTETNHYKSQDHGYLPLNVLGVIELYDEFSDDEYNGRINHRVQSEPVHLKIVYETPEQLNNYQETEDIGDNRVKCLPKGLANQNGRHAINEFYKPDAKNEYNEDHEDLYNILHRFFKNDLRIRDFQTVFNSFQLYEFCAENRDYRIGPR